MEIEQIYESLGVTLSPSGDGWKAPCPFHAETKASFFVYEDGHHHCFGCGAHGELSDILDHFNSAYKVLPEMGLVKEWYPINIRTLKTRLCSELYLALENASFRKRCLCYDAMDRLFMEVSYRIKYSDPLDLMIFIKRKSKTILNFAVRQKKILTSSPKQID